MNCQAATPLIPLYVDGELDRATARELEEHVDDCAACRQALQESSELSTGLRQGARRYAAPPDLRERIRREAVPGRTARRPSLRWLALAASWVLAFGIGAYWSRTPVGAEGSDRFERDLLAGHLRALAAATPVDVVSSDRHTVKPWFAGKIALAPPAADFSEQGFALVGGRIDYVGDARVAVLVYRHGPHLVDVFVLPPGAPALAGDATRLGYRVTRSTLAGQAAAIVSDLDESESTRLARLLAAES